MQQAVRADPIRIALAAAVPLGVLALAYAAWAVSDRIGSIGPLDKAKLGWLIVVPLLGLAPVGAAFAWRSLTNREATAAAVAMAAPLAIATTLLFWLATAHPDCQFGSRMSELDALGISAGVGVLTGAGYAMCGLLASGLMRSGHPWWALVAGVGSGIAMFWLIAIAAVLLSWPYLTGTCNRGPI